MSFEPLPDPVTDEVVNPAAGAYLVALTNGTEAGFFGVEDGVIYQSFDGLDWTTSNHRPPGRYWPVSTIADWPTAPSWPPTTS